MAVGQGVRGHRRGVDADAVPALDGGADRPRPAARVVAVEPVPVGADGRLDRRAAGAARRARPAPSWRGGGCGPTDRARSTTWRGGRSGRRPTCAPRSPTVGAVEVTTDTGDGAGGAGLGARRRPRRHAGRARRARRLRAGGPAAGARPDDHGLEGPRRGTSDPTGRRCSTATATPVRPCGSVAGRSGRGASATAARSSPACSRPSTRRHGERVDAAAERLTAWMDGVRVTPRFPTPLDRELAGRP